MAQSMQTACECRVNLPHTPDQVWRHSTRTIPTYRHAPNDEFETEGVWAYETANLVNDLNATVQETCSETEKLKRRIGCLEDRVEYAEKTGVIQHSQDCAFSKRFVGSAEPQPPKPPNRDKATIKMLEEKLKSANKQLVQNRNQMMKLREEVKQSKRLLEKELGLEYGIENLGELLRSNAIVGWKGRAQTIRNLRARIANLESKLFEAQMHFRHDVEKDCYSPTFQADINYAVSRNQRQLLNKIYVDKNQLLLHKDEQLAVMQEKYYELEKLYKVMISRNKTLSEELRDLKKIVSSKDEKSTGDETFIEALMTHQHVMRDMLNQKSSRIFSEGLREQDLEEVTNGKGMNRTDDNRNLPDEKRKGNIECEKYKTLLQISENTTQNLENMIVELRKRLDIVSLEVIEAEKHCSDHHCQLQELRKQFEQMKKSGKAYVRAKHPEDKQLEQLLIDTQLQAMKEENNFLRNFVKDTLLAKADDFQLYKSNLESAKRGYLASLKQIEGEIQYLKSKNNDEEEETN